MKHRALVFILVFLAISVGILASAVIFCAGCRPSVPSERIVRAAEVNLPPPWEAEQSFTQGSAVDKVLVARFKRNEESSILPSASFIKIQRFSRPLLASLEYMLTRYSLPGEVYSVLPHPSPIRNTANQSFTVCSWPNAGVPRCRTHARYGQYLIIFQIEVDRSRLESEYLETWDEVDKSIARLLE